MSELSIAESIRQDYEEEIERLKEENKILKESLGIKSPSKEMLEGKYWETKEIERLNNIINELETYIGIKMASFGVCNASDIYYKLQELKGSNKENV